MCSYHGYGEILTISNSHLSTQTLAAMIHPPSWWQLNRKTSNIIIISLSLRPSLETWKSCMVWRYNICYTCCDHQIMSTRRNPSRRCKHGKGQTVNTDWLATIMTMMTWSWSWHQAEQTTSNIYLSDYDLHGLALQNMQVCHTWHNVDKTKIFPKYVWPYCHHRLIGPNDDLQEVMTSSSWTENQH